MPCLSLGKRKKFFGRKCQLLLLSPWKIAALAINFWPPPPLFMLTGFFIVKKNTDAIITIPRNWLKRTEERHQVNDESLITKKIFPVKYFDSLLQFLSSLNFAKNHQTGCQLVHSSCESLFDVIIPTLIFLYVNEYTLKMSFIIQKRGIIKSIRFKAGLTRVEISHFLPLYISCYRLDSNSQIASY